MEYRYEQSFFIVMLSFEMPSNSKPLEYKFRMESIKIYLTTFFNNSNIQTVRFNNSITFFIENNTSLTYAQQGQLLQSNFQSHLELALDEGQIEEFRLKFDFKEDSKELKEYNILPKCINFDFYYKYATSELSDLYQYFNFIRKLLSLIIEVQIDLIENQYNLALHNNGHFIFDVSDYVFRLIPIVYEKNKVIKKINIQTDRFMISDDALKKNKTLEFKKYYSKILMSNYDLLVKLRLIRNKYMHKVQEVRTSSVSLTYDKLSNPSLNATFHFINEIRVDISLQEIRKLTKEIVSMFMNIQKVISVKKNIDSSSYIKRLVIFPFDKIIDSIELVDKTLLKKAMEMIKNF